MNSSRKPTNLGEQNLLVCVRIRPINEDETMAGSTQICHKIEDRVVVLLDPSEDPDDVLRANRSREKQFVFDSAFDGACSQEDVYTHTSKPLITNVINGFNATVFAYGATGAGKTYTMLGTDAEPGIMHRALTDLFREIEATQSEHVYHVTLSYLEIYNEMIRDLLNPSAGVLELREDQNNGVQVAGLTEPEASSPREVMEMLRRGNLMRTTEPTAANKTSSRSHAVLQIIVHQRPRLRNIHEEVRVGRLFLIDLAGSERASNTYNTGKRMVEGAHINRSLLALGNCINALCDTTGVKRYINYRDSKLTRLLKDALGGNCRTVMIAHVGPASQNFEESRNTLIYADRAKHIKTKIRRNVTDVSYHIAQYNQIISELRHEILVLRNKLDDAATNKPGANETQTVEQLNEAANFNRQKEKLLTSFKKQMEMREMILKMDSKILDADSIILLDLKLIQSWELEKVSNKKISDLKELTDGGVETPSLAATSGPANSATTPDVSVAADGGGTTTGADTDHTDLEAGGEEPEEVVHAREEMNVLRKEKMRNEKLKLQIEKELEVQREKDQQMTRSIISSVGANPVQQEILQLMCKVHELEIDRSKLQTETQLQDHELMKRELGLAQMNRQKNICYQIITAQQDLIKQSQISQPKELEELLNLFFQEFDDKENELNRLYPPDIDFNHDIRDAPSSALLHGTINGGGQLKDRNRMEDTGGPASFYSESLTDLNGLSGAKLDGADIHEDFTNHMDSGSGSTTKWKSNRRRSRNSGPRIQSLTSEKESNIPLVYSRSPRIASRSESDHHIDRLRRSGNQQCNKPPAHHQPPQQQFAGKSLRARQPITRHAGVAANPPTRVVGWLGHGVGQPSVIGAGVQPPHSLPPPPPHAAAAAPANANHRKYNRGVAGNAGKINMAALQRESKVLQSRTFQPQLNGAAGGGSHDSLLIGSKQQQQQQHNQQQHRSYLQLSSNQKSARMMHALTNGQNGKPANRMGGGTATTTTSSNQNMMIESDSSTQNSLVNYQMARQQRHLANPTNQQYARRAMKPTIKPASNSSHLVAATNKRHQKAAAIRRTNERHFHPDIRSSSLGMENNLSDDELFLPPSGGRENHPQQQHQQRNGAVKKKSGNTPTALPLVIHGGSVVSQQPH